MNQHGYKYVRKVNDERPKPYFGRVSIAGEELQVGGFATAIEAHQAAVLLKRRGSVVASQHGASHDNG